MDDLSSSGDRDVDRFVDANISSFAAWDVAVYLDNNADVNADVTDLAARLGRKEYEIEPVLHDLVDHGVAVVSSEPDGVVRYTLSSDHGVREVVSRFVELAREREVRLEFVRRVLARLSRG